MAARPAARRAPRVFLDLRAGAQQLQLVVELEVAAGAEVLSAQAGCSVFCVRDHSFSYLM
jgi:hypothetical protein